MQDQIRWRSFFLTKESPREAGMRGNLGCIEYKQAQPSILSVTLRIPHCDYFPNGEKSVVNLVSLFLRKGPKECEDLLWYFSFGGS